MRKQGITVLWVEQNAVLAVSMADYLYVLRDGNIVYEGVPEDLPTDKKEFFRQFYI
jgi:branched-chain amino acid transport system ATP-binding protein